MLLIIHLDNVYFWKVLFFHQVCDRFKCIIVECVPFDEMDKTSTSHIHPSLWAILHLILSYAGVEIRWVLGSIAHKIWWGPTECYDKGLCWPLKMLNTIPDAYGKTKSDTGRSQGPSHLNAETRVVRVICGLFWPLIMGPEVHFYIIFFTL